jgi:hypothetical protein
MMEWLAGKEPVSYVKSTNLIVFRLSCLGELVGASPKVQDLREMF